MRAAVRAQAKPTSAGGSFAADYSPRDLERLCVLDRQCFPAKIAYPPETMREAIEEKGAFSIVAEDQSGSIAAFVVAGRASPGNWPHRHDRCRPPARRRGLGTRLMQTAEARLTGLGVQKIGLETASGNAARRLFAQLGYKRVGKIERYYPDGSDAWVMEKTVEIVSRRPV